MKETQADFVFMLILFVGCLGMISFNAIDIGHMRLKLATIEHRLDLIEHAIGVQR